MNIEMASTVWPTHVCDGSFVCEIPFCLISRSKETKGWQVLATDVMLLTSVFDSDVNKTTRFKAKTVTKTMSLKTQDQDKDRKIRS